MATIFVRSVFELDHDYAGQAVTDGMNQLLLERAIGSSGPNSLARIQCAKLLGSFRPASFVFDGGERGGSTGGSGTSDGLAHVAGVNALALEKFDGKILISGGSDGTIRLWDLEQCSYPNLPHIYQPVATIARGRAREGQLSSANVTRTSEGHHYGVTQLTFYPFDRGAFLSSSFDNTLKLWSTESAQLAGSFELGAKVFTHAISPIASHLVVACATQHPAVRLVDLRTSSSVQALLPPGSAGNNAGANLAVAWSPAHEHVLLSGASDGAVRVWDIRQASGLIALLDQEDSLGIDSQRTGPVDSGINDGLHTLRQRGIRASAKAHAGPVNGLTWTDDARYIISAGLDRRVRVWDASTGANTLVNFGPSIKNGQLANLSLRVSPVGLTLPGDELLFYPSESELLVLRLHTGSVVTRLRGGTGSAPARATAGAGKPVRVNKTRVTSLVWRGAGGSGCSSGVDMGGSDTPGGIYSGHLDGRICAWVPAVEGLDDESDNPGTHGKPTDDRAKRRKVVDDAYRSLMGKQITFA